MEPRLTRSHRVRQPFDPLGRPRGAHRASAHTEPVAGPSAPPDAMSSAVWPPPTGRQPGSDLRRRRPPTRSARATTSRRRPAPRHPEAASLAAARRSRAVATRRPSVRPRLCSVTRPTRWILRPGPVEEQGPRNRRTPSRPQGSCHQSHPRSRGAATRRPRTGRPRRPAPTDPWRVARRSPAPMPEP